MLEFIAHYWLQVLFGIIATATTGMAKRFRDLYKQEQNHKKEIEQQMLEEHIRKEILSIVKQNREESRKDDKELQEKINKLEKEIGILKSGILAIQGVGFKQECRRLLNPKHIITLEEWDALNTDYEVYHALGGNHDGDRLYEDVAIKYRAQLDTN